MKNPKYHVTIGRFPKSNRKIVERGKINTPSTLIQDSSISWLGTSTSIKSGGLKLILWIKPLL